MLNALDSSMEFNTELLRRNYFCIGVKRGKRYVCGGDADEDSVNNAVELLDEAVRRILKWHVWDTWWIEEWTDEWLSTRDRLEIQLRGKYSEEIVNTITELVNEIIDYNERFREYWLRNAGNEIKTLINDLTNSNA